MLPEKLSSNDVVVAMSGGVDSCVAALLLANSERRVIGVSMQVWDYRTNGGCDSRATCCSPDDFTDARKVAAKLNIPYYVFDFEKEFRRDVIDKFVATYQQGQTPNPCVDCNNKVKFHQLRNRATALGFPVVATGHYAEIAETKEGYVLKRPRDRDKDQTYFLYNLSQAELATTVFPLAPYCKSEVRDIAREAGLAISSKPESQDICFISGSVQDFLVKIGKKKSSGYIVDSSGTVLGTHEGIENYTVGQRKGLQLGGLEDPLYVIELDAETNQVIVGTKGELETPGFIVTEVSWSHPWMLHHMDRLFTGEWFDATVQMRHRHSGVSVQVRLLPDDACEVRFKNDWSTVSPGQAAVFYDSGNSELFGGGRIKAALRQSKKYAETSPQSCYTST